MERTKIFKSNQSQTVRLPKSVALPENVKEVSIIRLGTARLIVPHSDVWDSWFDNKQASEDFMITRNQPGQQERELIACKISNMR